MLESLLVVVALAAVTSSASFHHFVASADIFGGAGEGEKNCRVEGNKKINSTSLNSSLVFETEKKTKNKKLVVGKNFSDAFFLHPPRSVLDYVVPLYYPTGFL